MTDSTQDSLFAPQIGPSAWYTAYCDGGSRGNPGPAGFGAIIQDPEGEVVARISEFLGRQTNNYAEYSGLIAVLDWATLNGVRRLRVHSDSELMVRQMKGRYKVSSPTLRPLWEKARRRAAQLDQFEIRHTLREGNKEADRLANEAMDQGTDLSPGQMRKPSSSSSSTPAGRTASAQSAKPAITRPVTGIVQGGVVQFLQGSIPEGTFVQVIPDTGKEH
jgi:ribonuclease HI